MAWIELHQGIFRHPKTIRAASKLGVSAPVVVGHLAALWTWCLEYALDGDLSGFDATEVAFAAQWHGDAIAFLEVLVSVGFVDRDTATTKVHDWLDYAGRLVQQRAANADRMRRARASNVQRTSGARSGATVPNQTQPDQPNHRGASPGEAVSLKKGKQDGESYTDEFSAFWAAYPSCQRKTAKGKAYDVWRRHRLSDANVARLMAALDEDKASPDWNKERGRFVPAPVSWLNRKRWTDERPALALVPPISRDADPAVRHGW